MSMNLAGGAHLRDLVTGTNKRYQGWLQHREKSRVFKNTFLIQILVWLKSNKRDENWRKPELCAGSSSWLSEARPADQGARRLYSPPPGPPPCPHGIKQWTEDDDRIQKGKMCKEAGQNFKEGKEKPKSTVKKDSGKNVSISKFKSPKLGSTQRLSTS